MKDQPERIREIDVLDGIQIFDKDGIPVFTGKDIGPSMVQDRVPETILEDSLAQFKLALQDEDNVEIIDLGVATGEKYETPLSTRP